MTTDIRMLRPRRVLRASGQPRGHGLLTRARSRHGAPDSGGGTTVAGTYPQVSTAGTVQLRRPRPPAQLHTPRSGLGTNRAGRITNQHVCSRGAHMAANGYQHRSIRWIALTVSRAPRAPASTPPREA